MYDDFSFNKLCGNWEDINEKYQNSLKTQKTQIRKRAKILNETHSFVAEPEEREEEKSLNPHHNLTFLMKEHF